MEIFKQIKTLRFVSLIKVVVVGKAIFSLTIVKGRLFQKIKTCIDNKSQLQLHEILILS